jgi:hypothetical protein
VLVSESPDAAPVLRRRFEWIRAATDRVPTRWFAGVATAAFLAATAAFGGLATAAPPELKQLEPGEPHVTDQRSFTVKRAVLIDELSDAGVDVEEGQRVFAVIAEVENTWTEPMPATGSFGIAPSFSIEGIEMSSRGASARLDDSTWTPLLQPGVPATIVYAWPVEADRYSGGEDVEVTLYDTTLITGSFVSGDTWWDNPVAEAVVTVAIEDVGAGVDAEAGADE